ncbi:AAA family ATPase [Desulfuribacillus alkaliarsenatis]|uniref:AAA family ATPase n=1 Tax=Desulfuribacillus alkaliarsenatis TaxID=766136 RepID=A0A1E5G204_9FIRM|nr:AAA family ATPase [Desulfuribacillus alkaliarsenatis]OEF96559.1 AAA family ATPase [Desulfuribacillus alkaliarsenatis]
MLEKGMFQYIRSVELKKIDESISNEYPFSLKAVKELPRLDFHPNVTFLLGENGSGKSTLLEAIAINYGFNPEGGSKNFNFTTNDTHSKLSNYLRLAKGMVLAKDGYFLRAESFYNLATNIDDIGVTGHYGGASLHQQSHGESFMALLLNRFHGNGLYILDEPEAALSPTRQMALVARIHELVKNDSQFIIATHSPIVISYPHATIYNVEDGYATISYEETEHHQVMKSFMNNTKGMLDNLLSD